ncbi:hypothetical protein CRUP_006685, partial [Coryphaenoides rupestris]
MPESCWESCSTMAMTKGWRYARERNSSTMVTFFSRAIFIASSFISCRLMRRYRGLSTQKGSRAVCRRAGRMVSASSRGHRSSEPSRNSRPNTCTQEEEEDAQGGIWR